ncbi:MAG: hypothetical protein ACW97Z_12740 [Candidatus Hodarchaeales archaeon]|jgi:hypothetical protein
MCRSFQRETFLFTYEFLPVLQPLLQQYLNKRIELIMSMEELLTLENYPDLSKPWNSPCLICDHLERCGVGQEFNPIGCPWLNNYIALLLE